MISIELPLVIVSANVLLRMNRHVRAKKTATQRGQVRAHLFTMAAPMRRWLVLVQPRESVMNPTHLVVLTRLSPRELDTDNVIGGLKAVRDGVADALGIDDRDPRVEWIYAQEKTWRRGVRIEIEVKS